MAPKHAQNQRKNGKKRKLQRVRVTNKALESRQFSTVRLPRTSEVPAQKADVHSMYQELACGSSGGTAAASSKSASAASAAASPPSSSGFDPIANDAMFTIVTKSKYWPPPSLEELHAKTGHDHGDGFDSYDRREDDKKARKERVKVVKGEVNHPRGKPRQNTVIQLSDSSSSDGDDGEHGGCDTE
ncbi:hypothetical protein conserved [Leishmania donovani]|uniref:Uncharacterized protein n=3 Tax=Leishmania donovani species complex TaxID=38574 RepID=A4HWU1_LEIIN|nr:conserved hypothetical protein [Leishmania infantum JPCM5]XP_003859732.1 hypothetical protein, conserved [Leishmania donovani]CAC9474605.1 hypothetical_protein_-_conserved [Leishmania infantum]AYU77621.1 hypothetical protein LdCL_160009300 [Leishmania donovani]TPP40938.1 hypothetical protein CGC20_36445 [Leishmania donovani]TPP51197.1 hypothetical protein CGC21_25145 [Leishmania donovani]CAJ1987630.1 hypothetical protein conserved [Leishmania donovani]|eukprot:XP_001464532.1 conserved hypothetical protein [Leishmania infantum JPCM5]